MANLWQQNETDGRTLLSRVEMERIAGTVQYRRFDGAFSVLEQRAATAAEAQDYARWEAADTRYRNEATINQRASAALAANRTFLALPSPNNAQTLAQVRALTRQVNGLLRLRLDLLDDSTDT